MNWQKHRLMKTGDIFFIQIFCRHHELLLSANDQGFFETLKSWDISKKFEDIKLVRN